MKTKQSMSYTIFIYDVFPIFLGKWSEIHKLIFFKNQGLNYENILD